MLPQYHRLYNSFSESLLRKSLLKPLQQINNTVHETNRTKDNNIKRANEEQQLPKWLQESLLEKMSISSLTPAQLKLHRYITAPSAVGDKRKRQQLPPPPPLLLVKGSTGQGKSIGYLISTLSTLLNPAILTSPTIFSNRSNRKAITTTTTTTKTQIPVAPRILILTPTAILQQQLLNWTSTIISSNQFLDSKHDSIVQMTSDGGGDGGDAMLGGTPHLLIATPKEALEMYSNALLVSDNLELLIMDEVDSLLGLTKAPKTKNKKNSVHYHVKPALSLYRQIHHGNTALKSNKPLRTIVCSATLPSSEVLSLLDASNHTEIDFTPASGGGFSVISGSSGASVSNTTDKVKHFYRRVSNEEEIARFAKALIGDRPAKTGLIVLPKEYSKLCFIQSLALSDSCDVSLLSMAQSTADGCAGGYSSTNTAAKTKILIGSESDCRGLDLPTLEYIIVVDVPSKPSEWLHIIGRLGRLGQHVGCGGGGYDGGIEDGGSEIITIVNGSLMLQRLMDVYDRYDGLPRPLVYR